MVFNKRNFHISKSYSQKRIGPHNINVVSAIIGNLLGDGHAEKRNDATRFHIHMNNKNAEYIFWLHSFFNKNGYCSEEKPKVKKQIGKHNVVYFSIKFRTFSFSSLNYLYDLFYVKQKINNETSFKKRVPKNISSLLNEKVLAIWFMDDGGKSASGIKISTESFSYDEHILLQQAISEKFNLSCTIQKYKSKFILYFKKEDKEKLSKIIKPYMIPSMYYKLD